MLLDLIKATPFDEVQKELVISNKKWKMIISKTQSYYEDLKEMKPNRDAVHTLKLNREYFDCLYLETDDIDSWMKNYTKFISIEEILGSEIDSTDIVEFSNKALLVAGAISFITFDGDVFTEEERKQEVEKIKERLSEWS